MALVGGRPKGAAAGAGAAGAGAAKGKAGGGSAAGGSGARLSSRTAWTLGGVLGLYLHRLAERQVRVPYAVRRTVLVGAADENER